VVSPTGAGLFMTEQSLKTGINGFAIGSHIG